MSAVHIRDHDFRWGLGEDGVGRAGWPALGYWQCSVSSSAQGDTEAFTLEKCTAIHVSADMLQIKKLSC